MQGGIAIVAEVRVLEEGRVRFYDTFEEGEVGEVDSATDADRGVDHGGCVRV